MSQATAAPPVAPGEPTIRGPASGRMVSRFELPAADGRSVRSSTYWQRRNLVLLFLHGPDCARCREMLDAFAARVGDLAEENAQVLAVAKAPEADLRKIAGGPGEPFPILADQDGAVAARNGFAVPATVVADRFGEIWAAWEGGEEHALPDPDEVLGWLRFIEIQCPECHVPEPWE